MATYAEIQNDLAANAKAIGDAGPLVLSLRRGAKAIGELRAKVKVLEEAAQAEADAFERYRQGEGR